MKKTITLLCILLISGLFPRLIFAGKNIPLKESDISENYTQGVFILNEDWYGHQNGTINFLTDDGDFYYRIFQKENPGQELGCTSQFATIYGGKMYILSKQEKDPGAAITGSRLVVCDAVTMKCLKSFEKIATDSENKSIADSRAFLGVNEHTGYIGTSNGIYLFDIDNLEIGQVIEGTGGSATNTYSNQIGNMLRVENRVFAVHQSEGILVIDATTNKIETIIKGHYGSIIQSLDGNLWISVCDKSNLIGNANPVPILKKLDPYTLGIKDIALTDETAIPNSWYAWTADGFCASARENKLYWRNNGSGMFNAQKIYCFDIATESITEVFDASKLGDWIIYGTGFRIDPESDDLYISLYRGNQSQIYETVRLTPSTGNIQEHEMIENYWFPAMPVFPDNELPVLSADFPSKIILTNENPLFKISLQGLVTDEDNLDAAIVTTITEIDPVEKINATIKNGYLTVSSKTGGNYSGEVTLKFNSNGKILTHNIPVEAIELTDGIDANGIEKVIVYPNPATDYLYIKTNTDKTVHIFDISGRLLKVMQITSEDNQIIISELPAGIYQIYISGTKETTRSMFIKK